MTGNNLLSVCCLGYGHAPFIRDCITTIWQDSWPQKEIIALEDGSGDGSVKILQDLARESPCPLTVLEQKNTGNIPANFNRLLRAAKGDYVLFTFLDNMQIPGALEARMEKLLSDENCAFAAHTRCFVMEGHACKPESTPLEALAGITCDVFAARFLELERTLFHIFYIQGAVFRKSILQAACGFAQDIASNVLRTKIFFHLLAHPELKFYLLREPGFIYRMPAKNVLRNNAPAGTGLPVSRQVLERQAMPGSDQILVGHRS